MAQDRSLPLLTAALCLSPALRASPLRPERQAQAPVPGRVLHCRHHEILTSFWTRGLTVSFCTGPCKLPSRPCLVRFFQSLALGERQSGVDEKRQWKSHELLVAARKPQLKTGREGPICSHVLSLHWWIPTFQSWFFFALFIFINFNKTANYLLSAIVGSAVCWAMSEHL